MGPFGFAERPHPGKCLKSSWPWNQDNKNTLMKRTSERRLEWAVAEALHRSVFACEAER